MTHHKFFVGRTALSPKLEQSVSVIPTKRFGQSVGRDIRFSDASGDGIPPNPVDLAINTTVDRIVDGHVVKLPQRSSGYLCQAADLAVSFWLMRTLARRPGGHNPTAIGDDNLGPPTRSARHCCRYRFGPLG